MQPNCQIIRRAVSVLGVAALAAASVACSDGGGATGMDGDTVLMHTWIGGEGDREQWSSYIEAGAAVDPSVSVEYEGPPIGDFYTALPTVLRGNDAPCIVTLQNGRVDPYVSVLEPLEPLAEEADVDLEAYNDAMIGQLSVDGNIYALPFDVTPAVVFYNKAMFDEAGLDAPSLDWTRDDFVEAARATTTDSQWGFALGQGIEPLTAFMAADGETYVSEDRVAQLDDPALLERFEWFVSLATEEEVAAPLEASGGSFPDIDAFSTRQAAMMLNGLWALPQQYENLGEDEVGVATVPSDDGASQGFVGGTGVAVTQSCGDKEAAFNAIAAMTSAEALSSLAETRGTIPARSDAIDAWAAASGDSEVGQVVLHLTENALATRTPENLNEIQTLMTQYAPEAFSGQRTPAEVLEQVESALEQ